MAHLTREQFVQRWKSVKLLALDVDGVLTDDSLYFGTDGFELKRFNISDGFYMALSMRAGLELAIISGRYSAATDTRMKDLGVKHVLQGKKNKVIHIEPLLSEMGLDFSDIAFVGNEILDIGLAKKAGLSIAVADSAKELIEVVDYVTVKNGGMGAVREVIEGYFEATNQNPLDLLP
ncbi:MAG: HAD hydrolase family protein [candidate division Zixibacteria bacterium]|nr:HAD hydrolase family protein [candidate division Zixibacteria bacterium]MDH3937664.1 HAD hydrolase family protein [candidate division Zixibacteria bacterium]MDH4035721.1 HAD hydrolase family protein [candidate division Zixibacteria bacterium]